MSRDLDGWALDTELGLPMDVAEPPPEQQAVLLHLQRVLTLAAGAALLDGEHVGEVGGDLELDDRRHRLWAEVAHLDLLVPHGADVPATDDEYPRVGLVVGNDRPTKVQPLASAWLTASGSTVIPPTSSLAWLSTRMSAKNTPCVGLVSKSPERLLRQNV